MSLRTLFAVAATMVVGSAMAQPYVIRGSFNGWGSLGDLPLVDMGGGLYTATITGQPVGTPIEFKATTLDWSFNAPGDNMRALPDATGALTVNFFPNTTWADGYMPNSKPRVGYVDPLQHGWDVIGAFNGWSGALGTLADMGGGVYQGDFSVDPGTFEFKFRKAGDWDISIGDDFSNYGHNASVTNGSSAAEMTRFTLDLSQGRWKTEVVPEPASMIALGIGVAALLRRRKR